jgi:long-chain acyl-CoA synthetase
MLSSQNIITNLMQGIARLRIGYRQRVFGVLPLFHVFAQNVCVWGMPFVGACVILIAKIDRKLILSALKHKPTGFMGVPALYGLLCLLKTAPLDSVEYFVSGGDALPDKIRSYFELLYRRKICNGYGLTETSPIIAVDFADTAKPTSLVGRPAVGIEVEIRGEDGKPVKNGQIGELWIKGDNVMLGYYNEPEQTQKVLKDGWFNTGDTFYLNEDGKLVITGRTKDLIINKGINIYPQEIENVIMTNPNVIRVGVVGKPDDQGEVPVAFVQIRQEQSGIEEKLSELCKQQLAAYKVPRQFICTAEELPTTATGKVNKKELRKKFEQQ